MNLGKNVFSQLIHVLPRYEFSKYVQRYQGNKRVRGFSCWNQFLCMAFAQLSGRESLRRVRFFDTERYKRLVFLTNNFTIPSDTVANIYKSRWQVELFFKWIKGHLRIKAFYGTSSNAVKTQIWIAISIYLLVAIAKKQWNIQTSLHTFLQILEVNLFEKRPINQIVDEAMGSEIEHLTTNQLKLSRF